MPDKNTIRNTLKFYNNQQETVKLILLEWEYTFSQHNLHPYDSKAERSNMGPLGTGPVTHVNSPCIAGILKMRDKTDKKRCENGKIAIVAMFYAVECVLCGLKIEGSKEIAKIHGNLGCFLCRDCQYHFEQV